MPSYQLIILAVIALVILWQLYNVLGKKVGRQPEDDARARPAGLEVINPTEPAKAPAPVARPARIDAAETRTYKSASRSQRPEGQPVLG